MANLERYLEAQIGTYALALSEVRAGKKRGHWMWYVFPQLKGLGFSETSRFYSIRDVYEAEAYLNHPLLGARLVEICHALLKLPERDAHNVFGSPDDRKLKSSMTLFGSLKKSPVFDAVLVKFFDGDKDPETLRILRC